MIRRSSRLQRGALPNERYTQIRTSTIQRRGLEPLKPRRVPDLQSGAIATLPSLDDALAQAVCGDRTHHGFLQLFCRQLRSPARSHGRKRKTPGFAFRLAGSFSPLFLKQITPRGYRRRNNNSYRSKRIDSSYHHSTILLDRVSSRFREPYLHLGPWKDCRCNFFFPCRDNQSGCHASSEQL